MTTTKTWTRTRWGIVAAMAAAPLAVAPLGVHAAQEPAPDTTAERCDGGRVRGSLGITGLSCRDCSFESHNGSMRSARFGTEPVVTDAAAGGPLRAGDVLVALNGQLITTRAGADLYASLQPGEQVRVRVRRAGQEQDLTVTTTARCDRMPTPPRPPVGPRTPRAPAPPQGASPAAPVLPAPPALSAIRPDARLGFAFECDRCRYDGRTELWSFESYPVVFRVEDDGPAAGQLRAGDVLVALDGRDLREAEGGRAFAELSPGRTITWTVERDGARRTVTTRTESKAVAPRPTGDPVAPVVWRDPGAEPGTSALRYAGSLGDARVEVRGDPVSVSRTGDVLIIRTAGNTIRIDLGRPGGG